MGGPGRRQVRECLCPPPSFGLGLSAGSPPPPRLFPLPHPSSGLSGGLGLARRRRRRLLRTPRPLRATIPALVWRPRPLAARCSPAQVGLSLPAAASYASRQAQPGPGPGPGPPSRSHSQTSQRPAAACAAAYSRPAEPPERGEFSYSAVEAQGNEQAQIYKLAGYQKD
ncbi:unnamed protein product [Caretta caretta]